MPKSLTQSDEDIVALIHAKTGAPCPGMTQGTNLLKIIIRNTEIKTGK